MGANDKTQATFHGALPRAMRQMTPEEVQAAQLAELEKADYTDPETERIAGEGSDGPIDPVDVIALDAIDESRDAVFGRPDFPGFSESFKQRMIQSGFEIFINQSGQNSKDHGFHEDFPDVDNTDSKTLGLALTQKLMLMAEELLESFGEIRDGRSPYQTYYVDKKGVIGQKGAHYEEQHYQAPDGSNHIEVGVQRDGDVPLLKPEGFLVEIADLFIRGGDLIFLLACPEEFMHALNKKHEYNKTRPFKHGRQF